MGNDSFHSGGAASRSRLAELTRGVVRTGGGLRGRPCEPTVQGQITSRDSAAPLPPTQARIAYQAAISAPVAIACYAVPRPGVPPSTAGSVSLSVTRERWVGPATTTIATANTAIRIAKLILPTIPACPVTSK